MRITEDSQIAARLLKGAYEKLGKAAAALEDAREVYAAAVAGVVVARREVFVCKRRQQKGGAK